MKTKVMETTITSETVSQNTVSGEVEEPVTERVSVRERVHEIAKSF